MRAITLCILYSLLASCTAQVETSPEYITELATHRAKYQQSFANEENSPLTAEETALQDFYAADAAYKCTCTVQRTADAKPFEVDTYAGRKKTYIKHGIATCEVKDKSIALSLYKVMKMQSVPGYRDYLFVPFMDHTNGETTYGGGRYMDLNVNQIDSTGTLVIDFNKCYNPYCAFSDGYNCPIPPLENHLDVAIHAGEKAYRGEKKHRD